MNQNQTAERGGEVPAQTLIRAYLREELMALMPAARNGNGPFSIHLIESELERRDEINRLRADRLGYPHLNHA